MKGLNFLNDSNLLSNFFNNSFSSDLNIDLSLSKIRKFKTVFDKIQKKQFNNDKVSGKLVVNNVDKDFQKSKEKIRSSEINEKLLIKETDQANPIASEKENINEDKGDTLIFDELNNTSKDNKLLKFESDNFMLKFKHGFLSLKSILDKDFEKGINISDIENFDKIINSFINNFNKNQLKGFEEISNFFLKDHGVDYSNLFDKLTQFKSNLINLLKNNKTLQKEDNVFYKKLFVDKLFKNLDKLINFFNTNNITKPLTNKVLQNQSIEFNKDINKPSSFNLNFNEKATTDNPDQILKDNVFSFGDNIKNISHKLVKPLAIKEIISSKDLFSQIISKVSFASNSGRSEINVNLEPRILGQANIKLVFENGVLIGNIFVDSESVKSFIEANISMLKDNLAQKGLNFTSINVSVGNYKNNNQNFSSKLSSGFDKVNLSKKEGLALYGNSNDNAISYWNLSSENVNFFV